MATKITETTETTDQDNAETTAEVAPERAETPEAAGSQVEGTEGAEGEQGGNKASREAAKYRRQLRDTEAERDGLTGTVETLRRQIIAANMPQGAAAGAESLWSTGHTAAEMFNDAGALDTGKLHIAVKAAHETLGIHFGPDPVRESGAWNGERYSELNWGDALSHKN